jgi:membrane protein implicated in regulation of membrane protease activity
LAAVINTDVFLVGSLTWEWGMVFASCLVYLVLAELYKLMRRHITARRNSQSRKDAEEGTRRYDQLEKKSSPRTYSKQLRMEDTIAPGKTY